MPERAQNPLQACTLAMGFCFRGDKMQHVEQSEVCVTVRTLTPRVVTKEMIDSASVDELREIAIGLSMAYNRLLQNITDERRVYEQTIASLDDSARMAIEERDRVMKSVKSERTNFRRTIELKEQQIIDLQAAHEVQKKRKKARKPKTKQHTQVKQKYEFGSLRE